MKDKLNRAYERTISKCDDVIFLGQMATWIIIIGCVAVTAFILFY